MPISISAFKRERFVRGTLSFAAIFLFCLSYWIHLYFGQVDIHQIAYHLNFGLDIARPPIRYLPSASCAGA